MTTPEEVAYRSNAALQVLAKRRSLIPFGWGSIAYWGARSTDTTIGENGERGRVRSSGDR